jgi:uncharacterized protein YndB with AHSA1/START domain
VSDVTKNAIVIERIFDAPVNVIWQFWTQPEHFKQWYGPEGFTLPVAEIDFRIGGKRLFCMASKDGSSKFWLTGEYTEIVPNKRLVYTESMADEHGNILPVPEGVHPDDYPVLTTITVLLEDLGGRTKMVMTHAGVPASDAEATASWKQALNRMADLAAAMLKAQ